MDEIDRQVDRDEHTLASAIRKRRPTGPLPTGRCLYCDEILGDEQRWCDANCRDARQ